MRYPIILLAVLALALTAGTARADCPDSDIVYARNCRDLPVEGDSLQSQGCMVVYWTFEFFRTSETNGNCIVVAEIKNTSFSITIDSRDPRYSEPHSHHSISGTDVIFGSPVQARMRMKRPSSHYAPGPFSNLKLSYNIVE